MTSSAAQRELSQVALFCKHTQLGLLLVMVFYDLGMLRLNIGIHSSMGKLPLRLRDVTSVQVRAHLRSRNGTSSHRRLSRG